MDIKTQKEIREAVSVDFKGNRNTIVIGSNNKLTSVSPNAEDMKQLLILLKDDISTKFIEEFKFEISSILPSVDELFKLNTEDSNQKDKIVDKISNIRKLISDAEKMVTSFFDSSSECVKNNCFEDEDWESLLEAIYNDECILFIGHEITRDSNGESIHERFYKKIKNETNPYFPDEGFFSSDDNIAEIAATLQNYYIGNVVDEIIKAQKLDYAKNKVTYIIGKLRQIQDALDLISPILKTSRIIIIQYLKEINTSIQQILAKLNAYEPELLDVKSHLKNETIFKIKEELVLIENIINKPDFNYVNDNAIQTVRSHLNGIKIALNQILYFDRENVVGKRILTKLSQIHFKLIISTTPDNTMLKIHEALNIKHEYSFMGDKKDLSNFFHSTNDDNEEIKKPETLIYNPFRDPDTENDYPENSREYPFSHEQYYNLLTKINKTLPCDIKNKIKHAKHLLFFGFDFNKWHIRLLLYFLELNVANKNRYKRHAVNFNSKGSEIVSLIRNQFNISIVENEYNDFIDVLIKKGTLDDTRNRIDTKIRSPFNDFKKEMDEQLDDIFKDLQMYIFEKSRTLSLNDLDKKLNKIHDDVNRFNIHFKLISDGV